MTQGKDWYKKYMIAKKTAKTHAKKAALRKKQVVMIAKDVRKELRKAEKKINRLYD